MDVGQRPSRQRRHLPSLGSTLSPSQGKDSHDSEDSSDSYKPSRGRGRERKQKAKKRIKTSFENLLVSRRKATSSVTSGIHWRQWLWRACVLWIAFLCLRVMISVWQGDVTRLGWNQYLSQQPYRWWHSQ